MMIDTGLFSSESKKLKQTLGIYDKKFGLFGSCNHSRRILGTISFMLIFNLFNRKNLIIISLYTIFLFTITILFLYYFLKEY